MRLLFVLWLICLAGCCASRSRDWAFHGSPMFADLTVREMKAVRAYLHGIPEMKLINARSKTLKKNSILLMELNLPKKHEALRALDRGQANPPRQARVIIQFGNQTKPNITEYIVSPLPSPKSHEIKIFKEMKPVQFESRPITVVEYDHINNILEKITTKAHKLLFETTGGFSYTNCSNRCLTFSDIAPRGLGPGERRSWIMLQKFVEGYFIHPIGFEVLVNHQDLDPEKWTVEKVWYNSIYFDSVEELVEKYDSGDVEKIKLPNHNDDDLYSTYIPRGHSSTPTNIHGPKLVEPQGHRYHIERNFVEYAGWSFAYRVRSSAGLQVFDLRFNGKRIAYEISLQEAIAFYAGDTPAAMQTKYIDAGWAMGTSTYELAPGIDCPEIASFIDLYHYFDTDKPVLHKNALCVFEMTTAMPLRRHFDSNFLGGYNFYGGLENTVLVLRTTSTVYNYDYIWDFLFYQNGVVEVKVSASGYIHATFFTPNGLHYGSKVYDYVLGNLHTHLIHYKVDLDIAGNGYFIHPIGFEVLVNHQDLDPEKWTVEKVWYNSIYFDSVEELVEKYDSGDVEKIKLPNHNDDDLYSTYIPRGHSSTPTNIHGPKLVEPQGHRYHIERNFVEYAGWSFAYRVRSSAGLQVFDLRFNGKRIAYEISLQEAIAFYAGDTPAAMQTKYIDAGWAMGTSTYELAPGIDCPEIASFIDLYHYFDTDKPVLHKNALCVFEMTTAMPLRRHFDSNFLGGYNFYGGLENTVLVLRTTSTVYNYDYIWDFLFYQNGVVEVKVSASGYIHATFFTPNGLHYGSKVYDYVLGNLHTHLIHYKVDLDIAGRENSFETMDLKYVNFTNPWSPKNFIVQSKLHKTEHKTERSAAFRFGKKFPRYVHFYNPNEKNKWGHQKGYRIQFNSHAHSVLPKGWKEEIGISWSRYHLAVTRHKDSEATSSSIYTQNDPWEPAVSFENYINNEDIVNKDLVAWVTVGFLHVPHSEDIPNTATPGNAVGFFLRPFNFFDEDPSLASRSTVIIRPDQDGKPKVQRWTPEVIGHCVSDNPFFYNGSYVGV